MWHYLTIDQALSKLQPYVILSYARSQYKTRYNVEDVISPYIEMIERKLEKHEIDTGQSLAVVFDKVTEYLLGDRDGRGHEQRREIVCGAQAILAIIPELAGLPATIDNINEYLDKVTNRVSQALAVSPQLNNLGFEEIMQMTKTQLLSEHIVTRIANSKWMEDLSTLQEQLFAEKIITIIDRTVCDITVITRALLAVQTCNPSSRNVNDIINGEITRIIRDEPYCKMRMEFAKLYFNMAELRSKLVSNKVSDCYNMLVMKAMNQGLSLMEIFSITNRRVSTGRKESYNDIESISSGCITDGSAETTYQIKNILFDSKRSEQPGLCWMPAHGRLFKEEYNSNLVFRVRPNNNMVIDNCPVYHDYPSMNGYTHVAYDDKGKEIYIKQKVLDTSDGICTAHYLSIEKGDYRRRLNKSCIIYKELRLG